MKKKAQKTTLHTHLLDDRSLSFPLAVTVHIKDSLSYSRSWLGLCAHAEAVQLRPIGMLLDMQEFESKALEKSKYLT